MEPLVAADDRERALGAAATLSMKFQEAGISTASWNDAGRERGA
jgi:hypothetical protein